jgi:hypothetical protein
MINNMVLPLVDEHKPKCYLCHEGFENIEKLKDHHNSAHKEFFESHEKQDQREPAPGDVTVF